MQKLLFSTIVFVFAILVIGQVTESVAAETKIVAAEGKRGDEFGFAVAIDGNYAIVGNWRSADKGRRSGSALIYFFNGTAWIQQQRLVASDGETVDGLGRSVDIEGDIAIAGARGDDDGGSAAGAAYIFVRDGDKWKEEDKLLAEDPGGEDIFGTSVSLSGDYALVGAYLDDDGGSATGSAYIFKRNPQGGRWAQTDKLNLGKQAVALDTFGVSVSLSGDTAIIGAHQRDVKGKGIDSGAAYIFVRAGEKWIEKQELAASDGQPGDYFGFSSAISGDYAIVGAYLNDEKGEDAGAAYIYERDAISKKWTEKAKVTAGDTAAGDWFGYAVSIGRAGGNVAAMVGAPLDDDKGLDSGSVYSFARAGGWTEKKKTTNSDGVEDDYFGSALDMGGTYSISGAYRDDDAGDRSGAAYIYHSVSDLALPVEDKPQQFVLWGQIRKDALYQNFPNPFNPETWLPYQLATEAEVNISIYNVKGHLIRTLRLGTQPEGIYFTKEKAAYWDGQDNTGQQVSSGSYFYHLQVGDYSATKKMVILK